MAGVINHGDIGVARGVGEVAQCAPGLGRRQIVAGIDHVEAGFLVPDWLGRVRKRPSGKAEGKPREDFVVTIDRSDESTAFIKVRCQLPPRYFTDYLVAMKLKDGWQIVSKSYRYDLRE
jgi:hypothetical protein